LALCYRFLCLPGSIREDATGAVSAIERDMLRIWYDSPQELEIDRHFARLEELIRTFQPRRVLIDSLSTYSSTPG